jgi:cyclase
MRTLPLFALAFAIAAPAAAQQDLSGVVIRTETAAPGVSVLFGAGGNIAVSHGPDGTIVVDDQFAPLTTRIQAAIAALGAEPAKYLINTHWHGDHTGGNENFGVAGTIIMAQDHVRDRMSTQQSGRFASQPPSPAAALPVITWHDGIQIHLNGGIRTMHMPHAHTDGDSVVWFRGANVIHMGDLFMHRFSLPFVDLDSGGNVRGFVTAANRVIDIANDETVIIPGHGPLARKADLIAWRDMIVEVTGVVERERAAGKTLEQIVAMRPAARWDVNPDAFIKGDAFVTAVWRSLEAGVNHHEAASHGASEQAQEHGHQH